MLRTAVFLGVFLSLTLPATAAEDLHAKWLKAQEIFLRENYFHMNWKKTPSGLQFLAPKQRENPDAPGPRADSVVTVNYEVKLITGKVVDSSYARGMPLTISLAEVVPGWREAIPMMRPGETWLFVLPAELSYGDAPAGPIPAGSALQFKVELLKFERN
ncbi:MAG: FKBP-type peptidyl-prolyl cis-trans isomerase [Rhodospirillaceae bacterium]|nr:FKBP-type peptidyl-prolyl cis-trans isomerase [Rhodospirillaceae bacterium]